MRLADLLRRIGRRLCFAAACTQAAVFLAAAAAIAAASAWFDHRWPLPDALRWAVPATLAALAALRARRAVRVFRARTALAARYLDAHGGGGRTLNAHELAAARGGLHGSAELAAAEIRAVEAFWAARAVPVPPIGRAALALLACILCAGAAAGLGAGAARHQLARVLAPWTHAPRLSPGHFAWVWPPDGYEVPYEGALAVEARIPEPYGEVRLEVRGADARAVPLVRTGGARFVGELAGLTEETVIALRDGPFTSEPRRVRVAPGAQLAAVELLLEFPPYTGRPPQRAAVEANRVEVLAGTNVTALVSARNASQGEFTFTVGTTVRARGALLPRGDVLAGELRIDEGGTLRLAVGEHASAQRALLCECIPDEPPRIAFSFPPPLLVACEGSRVPVVLDASDDFGLAAVTLRTPGGVETRYPGGAGRIAIAAEIEAAGASKLVVSASAADIRTPVPRTVESPPRVIRVVDRAAFALLRRGEALVLLARRVAAVLEAAGDAKARCIALRAAGPGAAETAAGLTASLDAILAAIDTLASDPLLAEEGALVGPITDRGRGLAELRRARPPAEPETRGAWFAMVEYFLDELIGLVMALAPDADALAAAQPFLRLLAEAAALAERQDDAGARLRSSADANAVAAQEDAIRADAARLAPAIEASVPHELAPLGGRIAALLGDPELDDALADAAAALRRGERMRALDAALAAQGMLARIPAAIAAHGTFARLDLASLAASLGEGLAARRAMGLGEERVALWGPGIAPPPPPEEKLPIAAPLVFAAPPRPTVRAERGDFYRRLAAELKSALERSGAGKEDR
ncbi:MAG TPA: hypothetical protein DCM87_20975 [Planctomycetes bacterium]|nr:hypothetical protein [Planctomycetota bacterium]